MHNMNMNVENRKLKPMVVEAVRFSYSGDCLVEVRHEYERDGYHYDACPGHFWLKSCKAARHLVSRMTVGQKYVVVVNVYKDAGYDRPIYILDKDVRAPRN